MSNVPSHLANTPALPPLPDANSNAVEVLGAMLGGSEEVDRAAMVQQISTLVAYPGGPSQAYEQFEIRKRRNGEMRPIDAPLNGDGGSVNLRDTQRAIHHQFLRHANTSPQVISFLSGVSGGYLARMGEIIGGMDARGENIGSVLSMDIKGFYPSIPDQKVFREYYHLLFRFFRMDGSPVQAGSEEHIQVAGLLTHLSCKDGVLPQGAPTSPVLSNLVGGEIDYHLANRFGDRGEYFRYVDDLTFIDKGSIQEFRNVVYGLLRNLGYQASHKKTQYGEAEPGYPVLGTEVLSLHPKNIGRSHLGFKIVGKDDRAFAQEIREFVKNGEAPEDPVEFMAHETVHRFLGVLGWMHSVTKHGRIGEEATSDVLLPRETRSAYERLFLPAFADRLPEKHRNWSRTHTVSSVTTREERDVTDEDIQQRLLQVCDVQDWNANDMMRYVQRQHTNHAGSLQKSINEWRTNGDYIDSQIGTVVRTFLNEVGGYSDTRRSTELRKLVAKLVAFVQMMRRGDFNDLDEEQQFAPHEGEDSLFPNDVFAPYRDLVAYLQRQYGYEACQGLRALFWSKVPETVSSDVFALKRAPGHQRPYFRWPTATASV